MPQSSQNHALLTSSVFRASEFSGLLRAGGINRKGITVKTIAMGGASSAGTFAATSTNPALHGFSLSDDAAIGIVGVVADASLENGNAIHIPSSSRIRSGEYEGSRIDFEAHRIALTLGYEF